MRWLLFTSLLFALAMPATAQDEIVVTGSLRRPGMQQQGPAMPAITLKRIADFLVQPVQIVCDTRDPLKRKAEISTMLAAAIVAAEKRGASIQLAYGQARAEPLTRANYKSLPTMQDDDRDDTDVVQFLIKTPLAGADDLEPAKARIAAFINSVPASGRAELNANGEHSLSVVNPTQYRSAIIALVAADVMSARAGFGDGYAAAVQGLDRPVQWGPGGPGEVALFLPYAWQIVPKPD